MELVDLLVKELGVDKGQAEGGAGLILNMLKEQLGHSDFSQVSGKIPEIGNLVKQAPVQETSAQQAPSQQSETGGGLLGMIGKIVEEAGSESKTGGGGLLDMVEKMAEGAGGSNKQGGGGLLDMVGKLASSAGGDSELGKLGKMAQLGGAFEKLGLDPAMVSKFLPVILAFVEKKGGSNLGDLLKSVL